MSEGIPCTWMRGGTSKGAYFLARDLPAVEAERDALLLSVMGSPDPRQIDGIGGADPLTSKVAVVSASDRPGADVDYLFLQVFVDSGRGHRPAELRKHPLAGVAQFAVEKGLVRAADGRTEVAVHMVNSAQVAGVTIETPGGAVTYEGNARIDGVPGTAAPVLQNFPEAAGSTCGALLPTGNATDVFDGVAATCIDNGMPVVVLRAADLGITGYEDRGDLDANGALKERLEAIRRRAGPLMNLGDVEEKSVPKMTLAALGPRRRRRFDTDVHPPPLPRIDRRARRGERRHRLHAPGLDRPRPGAGSGRHREARVGGAPFGRDQRDDERVTGGRGPARLQGCGTAHRAEAVRGAGVSALRAVAPGSAEIPRTLRIPTMSRWGSLQGACLPVWNGLRCVFHYTLRLRLP